MIFITVKDPALAIAKEKTLLLNDEAGFHPSLTNLKALYDEGNLAILNNVGYPNPDRSHFRSMDIWQTASNSNEYLNSGWLGRYLDAQCVDCSKPTQVLEMDDMLSLALSGDQMKGIALGIRNDYMKPVRIHFLRTFYRPVCMNRRKIRFVFI